MNGEMNGPRVKLVTLIVKITYCNIPREFAAKETPKRLEPLMDETVKLRKFVCTTYQNSM